MKAIIFGSGGQDGFYLGKILERNSVNYHCISRSHGTLRGDVTDFGFVEEQISKYEPDYIFNFAANSTTMHSAMFENHRTISTGTINILEATRIHTPSARVFLSGSALQFENRGNPIDEKTPFEASSSYSVARIHSVYAARYFRAKFGLKIYIGYFFNHDSPLRNENHVNKKITESVKRIAAGNKEKLLLGNIDVMKEFSFAGDIMEAVWLFINQSEVFELVLGSGKAYSIRAWLEYCFTTINKSWEDFVVIDDSFVTEYNVLVSNPEKLMNLGWNPKISFSALADMMLK